MASLHPRWSPTRCASIPISVISSSTVLCHDFLGLPRGRCPSTCKFLITDKASPSSLLCTCPNHFNLLTLASSKISTNPHLCATSVLLTLSRSDTPESNLSIRLSQLRIQYSIRWVIGHYSAPYRSTERIHVVYTWDLFLSGMLLLQSRPAISRHLDHAIATLDRMALSTSPCLSTMLPR